MADPRKAAQIVEMAIKRSKQAVLSQAEREANLAKMLEGSAVQDRLYHGTNEDVVTYDKNKLGSNPDTAHQTSQLGFFLTKSPEEASAYAGQRSGANVQPLHAAIKNPYETTWDAIHEMDGYELQKKLKGLGYDGVVIKDEGMPDNYVAFEPTQIKSAIGNEGTYDTTNPDITKAHGGLVHMKDGGVMPRAFNYSPTANDERNRQQGLPAEFYRMGQTDPTMQSYGAGLSVPVGEARLTADAIAARNAQMRDALVGIMLGAEIPVGEGKLRAEMMRPLMQGASPQYGLRYSRPFAEGGQVQRFDEGGDVDAEREQAELDRMRLELSNSPVIEATPQSTTQKLLGTVGGYMDRAGKFINESLEPIAQSNPVKTFLADMLLAAPLKGAGTALQDYTKTSRDITEDQPYTRSPLTGSGETLRLDPRVLDIAQFASPVVRGATKLAGEGAKAIAPFAKSTAEMAAELYGSGKMPFTVAPNAYMADPTAPKPSRVLAPANEQGFYSPVEAAALNLQRKSGSGQAILNDILKGENVRSDEIEAMGLDTFLKDKKNVTAAEVQDYIAQNKLGLGEATYVDPESIYAKSEALNTKIAEVASKYGLRKQQFGSGFVNDKGEFVKDIPDDLRELQKQYVENRNLNPKTTKFKQYSLPGGENYREVVLTLPDNKLPAPKQMDRPKVVDSGVDESGRGQFDVVVDGKPVERFNTWSQAQDHALELEQSENIKRNLEWEKNQKNQPENYRSSHWDEPNVLAHLRMSDRVTDGKKTLLVDEVQSDWHQAGREQGYANPEERKKIVDKLAREEPLTDEEEAARLMHLKGSAVPDAPYKEDWYQLALRRAVKEAIDGGYDRVALPTGQRVADRFDLSKQIDRIDYRKTSDGTYAMNAIKDGKTVFSKNELNENELSGIVGKDIAKKIVGEEGESYGFTPNKSSQTRILKGLDLQVGGEGMKKYYDEIYPNYLKKFGKKYGASIGKTTVDADGVAEPLHYMDITPAMREAFKTGIHMKDGGSVNLAEGGIVAGSQGLKYADDGQVSMEAGGYVPMRRGGKVELTNDLAKMRNELQMKKGRK